MSLETRTPLGIRKTQVLGLIRSIGRASSPAMLILGSFLLGLAVGTGNGLACVACVFLLVTAGSSGLLRNNHARLVRRMANVIRLAKQHVRELRERLDEQSERNRNRASVELANAMPPPDPPTCRA